MQSMEEQECFIIHRDLSFLLLLVPKFTEKVLVSLTRTLFMLWEKPLMEYKNMESKEEHDSDGDTAVKD